jgi:hypothetical protein
MTSINEELRLEVLRLHAEDQALLEQLDASEDPAFRRAYAERVDRLPKPAVFYGSALLEAWESEADAPPIVKTRVRFMADVVAWLKKIVAEHGWPRRQLVGDDAAFFVMFLFGHADTFNVWRRSQLPAIEEAFRDGEIDPRLYAHLVDRIEAVDGRPQIFGSVMGPGEHPGEARLYVALADAREVVDARRAEIGLPPLEDDLKTYREGATIGPYMTPTPSATAGDR